MHATTSPSHGDDGPDATDQRLESCLRTAGADAAAADLTGFAAGIAAAPRPALDRWLGLLGDHLDESAADRLRHRAGRAPSNPSAPGNRRPRLAASRAILSTRGLDGFFVPRADEHQGEYVPLCAERLAWITGFTGSAGLAIILADRAALFVDGRYTAQAARETDGDLFERKHLIDDRPSDWIGATLSAGGRIGYDSRLHTKDWASRMQTALEAHGITLVACPDSPLDAAWTDRPPPPLAPVEPHPISFAGQSAESKRTALADALTNVGADATILTQPDSIAWLLNVRGGDVPFTPLPLSFAIATADGELRLFIDERKLAPGLRAQFGNRTMVEPPVAFEAALIDLGQRRSRVQVDPESASAWVYQTLETAGATIHRSPDPCRDPKAIKNEVELRGARAAHRRDGVALVRFLAWLDAAGTDGTLTERAAADQLAIFRREGEHFRDLSFETISAAGPNGAIVHYRVDENTNRRLEPGSLYLLDSGAQYADGTTDVTRTMPIGTPTEEMRWLYTLVLRAHIACATARFPEGTTGSQLDPLARRILWDQGLDYDHGTGHGVGSYLSVHEGPQRLSKVASRVALKPGMILSVEPGYYRVGQFGIRLENLVAVKACTDRPHAERRLFQFEPLTIVPFDRRLIRLGDLAQDDRVWIDTYHAMVWDALNETLDPMTVRWLRAATLPLDAGPQ